MNERHPMDFECRHGVHWFDCPPCFAEIGRGYDLFAPELDARGKRTSLT
jgi:hypothetical protein